MCSCAWDIAVLSCIPCSGREARARGGSVELVRCSLLIALELARNAFAVRMLHSFALQWG